jgi:hypothetical protein
LPTDISSILRFFFTLDKLSVLLTSCHKAQVQTKQRAAARLLLRSASVEAVRPPPAVARLLPANMAYNMARTVRKEPPMSVGKIGMRIVVTARPLETVESTAKRMQWYSNKPVGIMEEGKGR